MTVLVTGATGFVGCHVARRFAAEGAALRVLVRPTSPRTNLEGLDAEVVEGDLRDPASLRRALKGCEALAHVAADYRLWARNPADLYEANVDGVRAILQAASDEGVGRVVYTSTVGALGRTKDGSPADEATPVAEADMKGDYKRSKFRGEQVAKEFAAAGLPVVIVNPSTPVGENDVKPTPTGRIIVDFLNRRLPAFVDTGLNFVDVRDVAAGTVAAMERGVPGERYILGGRNMTLREMLAAVADAAGMRAPRVRLPWAAAWAFVGLENVAAAVLGREPAHPMDGVRMARHPMYFSPERAVRELGMPQSSIPEALRRAVQWYRANGYAPAA